MSNVASETLETKISAGAAGAVAAAAAAAAAAGCCWSCASGLATGLLILQLRRADHQTHPQKRLPHTETQGQWRTGKAQNPTKKVSNVASETLETETSAGAAAAAAAAAAEVALLGLLLGSWSCTDHQTHPTKTALRGSEGRGKPKIPPKKCLTLLLKP